GHGHLSLLTERGVQDDLKPDEEQREKVEQLAGARAARGREAMQDFHKLSAEERHRRFVELARAAEKSVAAVLTSEQIGRLKQIALQRQGLHAFSNPEVVDRLELTGPQRQAIRAIQNETMLMIPFDPTPGRPPFDLRAKMEETWRNAQRKVHDLLTDTQKKRWQA